MGHIIIGYDDATMNEYIKDNFNGYLFSEDGKSIDFADANQIRKNSIISAEKGYKRWVEDKKNIIDFISSEYKKKDKRWPLKNYFNYILYSLVVAKNNLKKKIVRLYKNI